MFIVIKNYTTPDEAPIMFEGDPRIVELNLRENFPGALDHIQLGDINSVLYEISRMYGIQLSIIAGP